MPGGATSFGGGSIRIDRGGSRRGFNGHVGDHRGISGVEVGAQQTQAENRRFGSYLRKIREGRKLSLDAVEEMSIGYPERITKSHLSRIENGQAVPTFPRMFALSQIYGVPVTSLAERLEIEYKRETLPAELGGRTDEEVLEQAKKLWLSGLYADALVLYEGLLERHGVAERSSRTNDGAAAAEPIAQLRLHRINCMVHLDRFATAKDACEDLLSAARLTTRQRVVALQYLAICCYRLHKFAVAMLALEQAEREVSRAEDPGELRAHLATLKGRVQRITGDLDAALASFTEALRALKELANPFELCRARINVADVMMALGDHGKASVHLKNALEESENHSFDRLRALALSNLAEIAFVKGDLDRAETHFLMSNTIARPREFFALVFRNCFYLWKMAQARGDKGSIKANERSLRTYLSRADDHAPEAEAYRAYLAGGRS